MTISLPAGWAVVGLSADVDGMAVIEDCPPVVAGADGGWLEPPHAVSMPAESRTAEIGIARRKRNFPPLSV
jgi:hypothetical protein